MCMCQWHEGYVLLAVLVLMQVTMMMSIACFSSSNLSLKSAYDYRQRSIALQAHPDNMVSNRKKPNKGIIE